MAATHRSASLWTFRNPTAPSIMRSARVQCKSRRRSLASPRVSEPWGLPSANALAGGQFRHGDHPHGAGQRSWGEDYRGHHLAKHNGSCRSGFRRDKKSLVGGPGFAWAVRRDRLAEKRVRGVWLGGVLGRNLCFWSAAFARLAC